MGVLKLKTGGVYVDVTSIISDHSQLDNLAYDDAGHTGFSAAINASTTFYVNASTGNDTTGDGSVGTPWQTIQHAWDYLLGKTITAAVTISCAAGDYNSPDVSGGSNATLLISAQPYAEMITIQGDTRSIAGKQYYVQTVVGNDITIPAGTTVNVFLSDDGVNPTADDISGYTTSDFIFIGGTTTAGNVGRFQLTSVDNVTKAIQWTNASGVAENALTSTRVVLCPNCIISRANTGNTVRVVGCRGTTITGFTILNTKSTGNNCRGIYVLNGGLINAWKITIYNIGNSAGTATYGVWVSGSGSSIITSTTAGYGFTVAKCDGTTRVGLYIGNGSYFYGGSAGTLNLMVINCGDGFYVRYAGLAFIDYVQILSTTRRAIECDFQSGVSAYGSVIRYQDIGMYAGHNSFIYAIAATLSNSTTADFSPAVTDTEGNVFGIITQA